MTFRDYSSFDLDGFVLDILSFNLSNCKKFVNLDNALRLYDDILNSYINKHASIKTKFVKSKIKKPKWWNSDCQQAQRNRRQAERRYRKCKSWSTKQAFKDASKSAALIIDQVRNNYRYFKITLIDASGNGK